MLQQEYASTGHGAPGIPVGLTGVCECTLSASLRGSSLCAMDMTRVGPWGSGDRGMPCEARPMWHEARGPAVKLGSSIVLN